MRRTLIPFTAMVLLLTLVAFDAPVRAAAAMHDYDPSVDFAKYKSFRFIDEAAVAKARAARGNKTPQLSPLVVKQIVDSVKTGLQGRGLTLQEQGPADLGVAIHTGQQREIVGYGWGPRYVGPRRVEVNKEGVLTIDLVDRVAKELVWRGSIAAPIKEDPEKLHKQIDKLVEKVLANYPPKAKK